MKDYTNKLMVLVICAVVSVLVIVTIAAPILSSASESLNEKVTYSNSDLVTGMPYGRYWVDEDMTLVLDGTDAATAADVVITVNGETITNNPYGYQIMMESEDVVLTFSGGASQTNMGFITYPNNGELKKGIGIKIGTVATMNYDASEHTLSIAFTSAYDVENSQTYTVDYVFSVANDSAGNYVFTNDNNAVRSTYMTNESLNDGSLAVFISSATITIGGTEYSGSLIKDKYSSRFVSAYTGEYELTLSYSDSTLIPGTTDVYSGGLPVFTLSIEGQDPQTANVTKGYFITEITGTSSEDTPIQTMIEIMPLLMIVGVILAIVGTIAYNRQ